MSKYTIHMTHIVDVPDGIFDADEIADDPDYFINLFAVESNCDSSLTAILSRVRTNEHDTLLHFRNAR